MEPDALYPSLPANQQWKYSVCNYEPVEYILTQLVADPDFYLAGSLCPPSIACV
jgi:hypothetical protein